MQDDANGCRQQDRADAQGKMKGPNCFGPLFILMIVFFDCTQKPTKREIGSLRRLGPPRENLWGYPNLTF